MQAKPIICAQHPATAAPPAKPVKPSAAQIAAEEIGSVNAIPTSTDIKYEYPKLVEVLTYCKIT